MKRQKRGQAAFEYLSTYGWAILAALIAVGALAYFGFLNPKNMLPSKCDFGNQLECMEYRIIGEEGLVGLRLRNNFGREINITGVTGIENTVTDWEPQPLKIGVGTTRELNITLNQAPAQGEKNQIGLIITFQRAEGSSPPEHNISGWVFTTVQ